ncbi:MAG: ribbon-helix-helix domain-containing protein [Alphaproteobacteria bacterium]|jgi:predicted DNA-binding ribbon-helix-helix protein|nr:ribbon-helix-helix domain-containing protein [Alphaproteobacteria bacterium]
MKKISVSLSGHQTSITLEPEFISVLNQIATKRGLSVASIINNIDSMRAPDTNLSSAIRVWILQQVMNK